MKTVSKLFINKFTVFLIFLMLLMLHPFESAAQNYNVFYAPVYLEKDQKTIAQISLAPEISESLVEAEPVIEILKDILPAQNINALKKSKNNGMLSLSDLQRNGIDAKFNEEILAIILTIQPENKKSGNLSARPQYDLSYQETVPPSKASGYVNFRAGDSYIHKSINDQDDGRQNAQVNLDGAINIYNWALEGEGNYLEGEQNNKWQRNNVRLVHDEPKKLMRYGIGDLSYPVKSFQNFQPLLGVSGAKNYDLQPYKVSQPTGSNSFFIREPSNIDVLVNGIKVNSFRLEPGPYNINDFPVVSGSNEVQLLITDPVGRTEIKRFSVISDSDLLGKNLNEFSYNLGILSQTEDRKINYDQGESAFSGFYRHGINDQLTLGGNLQADNSQYMAGTEVVVGNDFGISKIEAAQSGIKGYNSGEAFQLSHKIISHNNKNDNSFFKSNQVLTLSTAYKSTYFAPLGTLNPVNNFSYDSSINYSRIIFNKTNFGISANYRVGRDDQKNNWSGRTSFDRSFFGDFRASISLAYQGPGNFGTFLNISWIPLGSRDSVNTSYNSFDDSSRINWNRAKLSRTEGVAGSLGAIRNSNDYEGTGQLDLYNQRAELILKHDAISQNSGSYNSGGNQLTSQATIATALAYSNGHFALSQPITNSFAMIVPAESLKNQDVKINSHTDFSGSQVFYDGRNDNFGPIVLPNLTPYFYQSVKIDSKNLPIGYNLDRDSFALKPTYKSGTYIQVGSDENIFLTGTLQLPSGKPAALQTGRIARLGQTIRENGRDYQFFTNRAGRFFVDRLKPGTYNLALDNVISNSDDLETINFNFTIPPKTVGRFSLGVLTLEKN